MKVIPSCERTSDMRWGPVTAEDIVKIDLRQKIQYADFYHWIKGFSSAIETVPTPQQWGKILEAISCVIKKESSNG